ncbi:hypothetical protein Tco_0276729, partial [Tanacetum coccineum]
VNEARGAKDTLGILFWGILSCLLHPQSPTHLSTLILSQGESSGELMRSCLIEVLHESSYTDTMDSLCNQYDDDDTDDDDEEPFEDEDDDEEEEHLAPADSSAIPVVDPVPLARDTKVFETDETTPTPLPSPRRHTARISVRPQTPILLPSEAEVERLLALPIPPPSPLSPWSSPLPQIPSPPLLPPPSSLHLPPHVPTSLPLPSSPLPPLPALLFIPPPGDHKEDIPKADLPPRKRLCPTAPTSSTMDVEIRRQRAEEVGYGIRDVWVDPTETVKEVALTTLEGVNARVTELAAGQLSAALGQIQALQARDQTHVDDPEGAGSSA